MGRKQLEGTLLPAVRLLERKNELAQTVRERERDAEID